MTLGLGEDELSTIDAGFGSGAILSALVLQAYSNGQYLIEITAYRGGEIRGGGLWAIAEGPIADIEGGTSLEIDQIQVYLSDMDWMGDINDPDRPSRYYEGRVLIPLTMERSMPLLPEDERRVQRQFGFIEISNADGALDTIIQSYAVDGRQVRVLFGPSDSTTYSDFSVIADVVGTGWESDETSVRIGLRDRSYNLDLPLQSNLYLGTGGINGTIEIQGKPKPILFGIVRNILPVLVAPSSMIYQINDGPVDTIDKVYDRGSELVFSGSDVSDYITLVATPVADGYYATCKALGIFKLGAQPFGVVTVDASESHKKLDDICHNILRERIGLSEDLIHETSFENAALGTGDMGLYISTNDYPTTAQILSLLFISTGGWWGAARDGRIRAGRLSDPEHRTPDLYLDENSILEFSAENSPLPRWRQRVNYQRNWTVQRGEDLSTTVNTTRRQFLIEEFRSVSTASNDVRVRHINAIDPDPISTLYDNVEDAQALSDFLFNLHSPDRRIFRIVLKRLGYLLDLNSFVHVTWPRLGLSGGKLFAVIGIREDAERDETTIRIWG